mgnify:CR=1 FL=1
MYKKLLAFTVLLSLALAVTGCCCCYGDRAYGPADEPEVYDDEEPLVEDEPIVVEGMPPDAVDSPVVTVTPVPE